MFKRKKNLNREIKHLSSVLCCRHNFFFIILLYHWMGNATVNFEYEIKTLHNRIPQMKLKFK